MNLQKKRGGCSVETQSAGGGGRGGGVAAADTKKRKKKGAEPVRKMPGWPGELGWQRGPPKNGIGTGPRVAKKSAVHRDMGRE